MYTKNKYTYFKYVYDLKICIHTKNKYTLKIFIHTKNKYRHLKYVYTLKILKTQLATKYYTSKESGDLR